MRYNIRAELTCLDPLRFPEISRYLQEILVTHIQYNLGAITVFMDEWQSDDLEEEMYRFALAIWKANGDYADIEVYAWPIDPLAIHMKWDAGDWMHRRET